VIAHSLWDEAMTSLQGFRGAETLIEELSLGGLDLRTGMVESANAEIFGGQVSDGGFAILFHRKDGPDRGLVFVSEPRRRRGQGTLLLERLRQASPGVRIYALPGDRLTKSLCESNGLNAKLLLMGEA
jgi:GNAT superfamily N-acetyltransferase